MRAKNLIPSLTGSRPRPSSALSRAGVSRHREGAGQRAPSRAESRFQYEESEMAPEAPPADGDSNRGSRDPRPPRSTRRHPAREDPAGRRGLTGSAHCTSVRTALAAPATPGWLSAVTPGEFSSESLETEPKKVQASLEEPHAPSLLPNHQNYNFTGIPATKHLKLTQCCQLHPPGRRLAGVKGRKKH